MSEKSRGGSGAASQERIAARLVRDLEPLRFGAPVACVYNPLAYARAPHALYASRYGQGRREILLLGMNPGPWGMAQTGVPFGEVRLVREWLGIHAAVEKPQPEHPRRPILGFECARSEVSGTRLWGWAREVFGTPERFFARFYVANYCPLVFMDPSGRNVTPDQLPRAECERLFSICDQALRASVELLQPRLVIGVGGFAAKRARIALEGMDLVLGQITHPSPANPKANRGWAAAITKELADLGIELPRT